MKKLFKLTANWLIHHSEEYRDMAKVYAETIEVNESLKTENKEIKKLLGKAESEKIEIEENYDFLVDETAEQIKKFIKVIKKIRTHVNKLDKKDENVKEIKRLIKEVL